MAESEENKAITSREAKQQKAQGPWFSLFPGFRIPFAPLKQETKVATTNTVDEESKAQKPEFVSLPDARQEYSPLKLEVDEAVQGSSSRVLWQVYALGGFMVLRWIWARWKERRAKDDSSGEPSPGDDGYL
ncbi:PREDICTED: uncharacterized protein LOC104612525 [Nelumbo nucifera]|uniref:Uncharacterized protein n=2 Tax=Nelumbo nucifera TaxID=4432 RepID=A0A822Y9C1_NELNU|nr:PREDICTED: uncharacterized protein LOC104612525 [Nelumbo nucifera]DAD28683.1 TPA_asm: hypothetical protein HUJ06_030151 [Nelumbo nucifera]